MQRQNHVRPFLFLFGVPVLVVGLCAIAPGFGQAYAPQPMRLQAKTARTTIPAGSQSTLTVSFLDRNYGPTSNDARRTIELQPEPAGIVDVRRGIEAMPGQRDVPVQFTGLKPGRVLIRVISKGLEPATVVVIVAAVKRSTGFLVPQVWAADSPNATIVVTGAGPVPANGKSLSPFVVVLDQVSTSETRVRIDTNPPGVLLFSGRNTRLANGSLIVIIPAGEQSSQEVQARTTQPGSVVISARVLPSGKLVQTTLAFEDPRPASLAFEDTPTSIPVGARSVPLRLEVADQDNIPLQRLSGTWTVSVRPSDTTAGIRLDPDHLVLSPQAPWSFVLLSVSQQPSSEELQVLATAEGNPLRAAEKRVGFLSSVGRLNVIVPSEVNRNVRIPVTALFLKKDRDQEAATEFRRTVTFHSDEGRFDPESVVVESGGTEANTMFVGQKPGQRPKISVSTRGVDVFTTQVLVVTALWVLVLVALGGGVIGGLARFFYYAGESWGILPKKIGDSWNPGLAGNAAFCAVFGVVALLMAEYALHPFDPDHHLAITNSLIHTGSGAFLEGIAGGFVGVGILEILAERLGLADALQRRAKVAPKEAASAAEVGQPAVAPTIQSGHGA
jgi:hypothetical protein